MQEETNEYYEAFGRKVCALMIDTQGQLPLGMRSMAKTRPGLILIGKMTDKKLREANDANYEMLRFQAQQDVERNKPSP